VPVYDLHRGHDRAAGSDSARAQRTILNHNSVIKSFFAFACKNRDKGVKARIIADIVENSQFSDLRCYSQLPTAMKKQMVFNCLLCLITNKTHLGCIPESQKRFLHETFERLGKGDETDYIGIRSEAPGFPDLRFLGYELNPDRE